MGAFIKNTLAREGSESYLRELRQQGDGRLFRVNDVAQLRDAVGFVSRSTITEPAGPNQSAVTS